MKLRGEEGPNDEAKLQTLRCGLGFKCLGMKGLRGHVSNPPQAEHLLISAGSWPQQTS